MQFAARSLLETGAELHGADRGDDAAEQPVRALVRAPPVICTTSPDRLGGEVLLEMLDRAFRHLPVVSTTGEVLGVIEDLDVIAARTRSPVFLRQRIAVASTVDELVSAAQELRPPNHTSALLLARFALSYRPPTGFFRGLVVEHTGEHRGRLDLKHGGVIPIVDLARWAGMSAGVTSASSVERLRAGAAAGTLSASAAQKLEADGPQTVGSLTRADHQIAALQAFDPG